MRIFLLLLTMTASLLAGPLPLTLRSRAKADRAVSEKPAAGEAGKTAIIVCDIPCRALHIFCPTDAALFEGCLAIRGRGL